MDGVCTPIGIYKKQKTANEEDNNMGRLLRIICIAAAMAMPTLATAQQCDTIRVPWYQNFDSISGPLASCWVAYEDASSHAYINGGSMGVTFTNVGCCYIVLPMVDLPSDSVWFRFHTNYSGNVEGLYGVMTSPSDTGSFVPFGSLPLEANSGLVELEFSTIGAVLPSGARLAFKLCTETYAMVYFDNFYIDRAASCPMPTEVWLDYVDTATAVLSWPYDVLSAGYLLTLDDTIALFTTDTTLTIDSLQPNHEYHYVFQSRCYSGELTPSLQGTFRTTCLPEPLPYSEDFSGYFSWQVPDCWQVLRGWQRRDAVHYVPSVFNAMGAMHLRFESATDTDVMVVTPMLAHPANQLHISFTMYLQLGTHMEVGVLSNPHDLSTFTPVLSFHGVESANTSMTHYDVYTETVGDTNLGYVAFHWTADNFNMVSYIGDVNVVVADSCHNPMEVHYDAIDAHGIAVAWTDNSVAPAGYEVRYATEDNIDSAEHIYFTDDHYLYVDSLNVNTAYWFWVRSMCSDTTEWIPLGMVRTICGQPSLPYEENFESYQYGERVQCWDYYFSGVHRQPSVYTDPLYARSGYNVWEFGNLSVNDTVMVVLPSFGVNARVLEVSFWIAMGRGVFEAGLYDISTNQFIPVEVRSEYALVNNNSLEQIVFQCDTITEANAFTRVAFRWSRHPYATTSLAGVAYIDDLRVRRIPLCHAPDSVTVNYVTDTAAQLRVNDSWSTGIYQVVYSTEGSTDTTLIYGDRVDLADLQHSSYYTVNVRGLCYDGTMTDEISMTFATECRLITHDQLPFVETFDGYTSGTRISPCWNRVGTNTYYPGYPIPYAGVFAGESGSSMQFLINGSCLTNDAELLVLPEVDNLNDVYVEFDVRASNTFARVCVGVMTDPDNPATFYPLSTSAMDVLNSWQHIEVPLNHYTGMGTNVAIGAYSSSSSMYATNQLYVDNVALRVMPQCSDSITWLAAFDVGESCASLEWNASIARNEGAVFVVHLLDSAGVELRTDTTVEQETMLCNLDDGTTYRAYVDLYCGDSVVATSNHQIGFTTRCVESTTLSGRNSTNVNTFLPFRINAPESSSEQIYRAAELDGTPGTITDISIYVATAGINVQDIVYGTIYLAHSTDTIVRQWIPLENMTAVYTGPINLTIGWNAISLATPFHYNGNDNLVVAFHTTVGGQINSLAFGTTQEFDSASVYQYLGYDGPIWQRWRNVMRFNICPDMLDICAPPTITSVTATDMSITMNYSATGPGEVHITRGWWNRGFVGEMDTTGTCTFTELLPATQYTVGVRQHCSNGEISLWSIRRITTAEVEALPPLVVEVDNVGYNSADVSWHRRSTETRWELRLFNTVTDSHIVLTDTSYNFFGLMSRTTYNVSVRSLCGSDYSIASPWSDTMTFTTDYCHPVSAVAVSDVTMTSAHVSWEPSDNGTAWKVEYGYLGFVRGDAIASYIVQGATSVDFDTLEPGIYYEVYVAALCGQGMTSSWVGTNPFHTPADAGISSTPDGTGFVVFPNPASTMVTVRLDADDPEVLIAVIDQQGRTVATATGPVATIDVSQLSAGVYFVRLSGATYTSVKKLIVK